MISGLTLQSGKGTLLRAGAVLAAAFLFCHAALAVRASSESAAFVSQSAALETSTIRGLLGGVSADVRGPASSYTLTIDSVSGDDVKALLAAEPDGVRYSLIECYDLSLTAINSQNITRNPQFGDITITIPLGSSMNPARGTFAIYTINTDGRLQRISCEVIYGSATEYAVRFVTIHFSTYAIVYTSGGATRVSGSRRTATENAGAGITTITNNDNTNAATGASSETDASGAGNSGAGGSQNTQTASGSAASATTASTSAAQTASTLSASANGKDENGKDPYYDNPKTGDRRYYSLITTAIVIVTALLILIARSKKRVSRQA